MKNSTTLCHESKDLGRVRVKKNGYRFPEESSREIFFKFKKDIITAGNSLWRNLPLSSKSIYPVIGCHCNKKGESWPSQQTIADLAGVTRKTVREGIEGLLSIPWFRVENKITSRGMRNKKYIIEQDDSESFPFHKNILETGRWRGLSKYSNSKAAHAVYCVCRAYGFQDADMYFETEGIEGYELQEFWEDVYPDREYDFLQADLDVIAEKAGVTLATAKKAMMALEKEFLLEWDETNNAYRVMLCPPMMYTREFLNQDLEDTQPEPTDLWKQVHGS